MILTRLLIFEILLRIIWCCGSVTDGPACEVVEIFLNKVIKLCDKNQSLVCFVITVKVFVLLYALSCTGDYVSTVVVAYDAKSTPREIA